MLTGGAGLRQLTGVLKQVEYVAVLASHDSAKLDAGGVCRGLAGAGGHVAGLGASVAVDLAAVVEVCAAVAQRGVRGGTWADSGDSAAGELLLTTVGEEVHGVACVARGARTVAQHGALGWYLTLVAVNVADLGCSVTGLGIEATGACRTAVGARAAPCWHRRHAWHTWGAGAGRGCQGSLQALNVVQPRLHHASCFIWQIL